MVTALKYVLGITAALLIVSCSSKEHQHHQQKAEKTLQKAHTQLQQQESNSQPDIAKYVENASFTSLKGKKVSVSDFKGKVVLIDFWETWCKPCVASMPTLSKLQKEFPNKLKVLDVTPGFVNTKKDARAFAKKHDYSFTYLMDTNNLHKKLHIQGIPYKIFIDPSGKFIKTVKGSQGPKIDYKRIKRLVEKYANHVNKSMKKSS
jgi:thiol-disulfide isomerase/thioredoxin